MKDAREVKNANEQSEPQIGDQAALVQKLRTTGQVRLPLGAADSFVDQLNNIKGSEILANNPSTSPEQRAILSLNALRAGELYGYDKPTGNTRTTIVRPTSLGKDVYDQAVKSIHDSFSSPSMGPGSGSFRNSSFPAQH